MSHRPPRHLAPLVAALCAALAAGACSSSRLGAEETGHPSLVFPAHFAEGDNDGGAAAQAVADGATASTAPAAGAGPAGGEQTAAPSSLPDPEPLALKAQWEYVLRYRRGELSVESVRPRQFENPVVTARTMGRFAFELWIGKELVDRVRFDFPLLGAEPVPSPRTPLDQPPTLSAGADVTRQILVPASPRATRAVLVDRATGQVTELRWPPVAAPAPAP